jgi:GNAT superfamily N-acetyltransferase
VTPVPPPDGAAGVPEDTLPTGDGAPAGDTAAVDASAPGSDISLRRARPDEAEAITALALRSKRLWGYDESFMARVTADMTLRSADLERDFVEVLEAAGRILGFYRLQRRPGCAWLEDLFIDPVAVRSGHGRRLFERACQVARAWGYTILELESDPNAEPFYVRWGAQRVGTRPSKPIPGRMLPWLRVRL